jgi:hypothetical protein
MDKEVPVRQRKGLIVSVLLSSLAVLVLGAALRSVRTPSPPVLAAGHGETGTISQSGPFTIHLPLIARWYDPDYVSAFGIRMSGAVDDSAGLDTMVTAGSKWVTTNLRWSTVEASKGSYDWSSFDIKAQNAQAAGIKLFVMFTSNPSWAAELRGGPVYNIQDLINISVRMAERYDCDGTDDAPGSPCVHTWSFYAEPDNGDLARAYEGKGYWGHNGAGYAGMLSHVSPAIHAANPRANVLIGGLAYDSFEEDGGPFVRSFLADTLSALNTYPGGATAYIDEVAFHYYPISAQRWPTIRDKALEIRGIMSQRGVGDLPLSCPEAAYWSSPKFGSSEDIQAQRLAQMYVRSMSVGMRPLSWYKVFDDAMENSPENIYPDRTAGLFRADHTQKPAHRAYEAAARELAYAYYQGPFQQAGIEGYMFQVGSGRDMTVLWATGSTTNVSFAYSCLRRVYLLGGEENIPDGSAWDLDGTTNGRVAVSVNRDQAIYVERCH